MPFVGARFKTYVADDDITAAQIAADAVNTSELVDDAVTSAKIADNAIITALIADDAITSAKIADDAITSALIADDAITAALIATGAVTNDGLNVTAITSQTAETTVADDDVILIYDTSASAFRKMTKSNFVGEILTSSSTISVTHSSHGLAVGDVIRPSSTNNQYTKSQADTEANAEVIGIVTTVTDTNNYTMTISGEISAAAAVPNSAAGTVLYLSESSAGALTATEPTTAAQVSKPVAIVTEQNAKMIMLPFRGEKVSTGLDTKAPNSVNYLVGTASADLSAEIVVGTSPGGELGGTWASPTIDDNIIDEANLKSDNSPTDNHVLTAKASAAGGLTWAAPTTTFVGCRAYTTSVQSISHNTDVAIEFGGENFKAGITHSTSSDTDEFTIVTAGYYQMHMFGRLAGANDYILTLATIKNQPDGGSLTDIGFNGAGGPSDNAINDPSINASCIYYLNVDDVIRFTVRHYNSANAARNTAVVSGMSIIAEIWKIG